MYSPRINPDLLKKLYFERKRVKKPMTKLINQIIEDYFNRRACNEKKETAEVLDYYSPT